MNYQQYQRSGWNIFLVDMKEEPKRNGVFSELAYKWIQKRIAEWKSFACIVNKKWYAAGHLCQDCGSVPQCDRCDIPIAYHKLVSWEFIGLCHICKKQYAVSSACKSCGWQQVHPYGFGVQRISEYLQSEFNIKPLCIQSDTVNSTKKIEEILSRISETSCVVGTSLLLEQIPGKQFDGIIVVNADVGLNIPDYRTNEQNFNFLYDCVRKHPESTIILQTFRPEGESIVCAALQNPDRFYEQERASRRLHGYPPFAELCVLLYKHEIEDSLFSQVNRLNQELLYLKEQGGYKDIELYATPPMIYKIFWKFRYNIIIKWPELRTFIDHAYVACNIRWRNFKVDRMAHNLIS